MRKCQSKKHKGSGCGDPRCPEGRSIQAAKDEAVLNNDPNSFIEVRELEESRSSLGRMREWIRESFFSGAKETIPVAQTPEQERIQRIKNIDKTNIPSFVSMQQVENHLNRLYAPDAKVSLYPRNDPSGLGLDVLVVEGMKVAEELRGLGVGRHMRATILKFADENNHAVMGIPTSNGDGTVPMDDPNFNEHALHHRRRLEKFYLDSGYEYNYAFKPETFFEREDWKYKDGLTGEPYPSNPEWKNQFSLAAQHMLENGGFFVRWPNNQIPEDWKA